VRPGCVYYALSYRVRVAAASPARRAARALSRFVGNVLAVAGVLLLADAGLTLAWQEPVSALLAARSQSELGRELDEEFARIPSRPAARLRGEDLRSAAARYRRRLRTGRAVARIQLSTLDRRYVMVEGTDTATLRKGPAHYPDTPLPGEGGTVGVAGHRTTYLAPFRTIDRLKPRDPIHVSLPYGRFTYRVERSRIVRPDALWVKRRVGYERLILTACHPLYSAAKRIVVFARLERADSRG
jgi:sortase A